MRNACQKRICHLSLDLSHLFAFSLESEGSDSTDAWRSLPGNYKLRAIIHCDCWCLHIARENNLFFFFSFSLSLSLSCRRSLALSLSLQLEKSIEGHFFFDFIINRSNSVSLKREKRRIAKDEYHWTWHLLLLSSLIFDMFAGKKLFGELESLRAAGEICSSLVNPIAEIYFEGTDDRSSILPSIGKRGFVHFVILHLSIDRS